MSTSKKVDDLKDFTTGELVTEISDRGDATFFTFSFDEVKEILKKELDKRHESFVKIGGLDINADTFVTKHVAHLQAEIRDLKYGFDVMKKALAEISDVSETFEDTIYTSRQALKRLGYPEQAGRLVGDCPVCHRPLISTVDHRHVCPNCGKGTEFGRHKVTVDFAAGESHSVNHEVRRADD